MDEVVESAFESSNQQPQKRSRHEDASEELGPSMVDKAISTGRPIADLFPSTTVMFGDIAGFTAWSSTRQPHQVFILLESLYGLFDSIAEKMGVFKVETIGDCYMAVAGLPDPRPDHAVVCAKFASECNKRMVELTSKLSLTLGPDTEELTMRFGVSQNDVEDKKTACLRFSLTSFIISCTLIAQFWTCDSRGASRTENTVPAFWGYSQYRLTYGVDRASQSYSSQ